MKVLKALTITATITMLWTTNSFACENHSSQAKH